MLADKTLRLSLTGLEVVHLTDSVANRDIAEGLPDKEAYVPVARALLLKLGSAYRELVDAEKGIAAGPVDIAVTEEEAWLLRSKVHTGDYAIDGTTKIGIPLMHKLFALLEQFAADMEIPEAEGGDERMTGFQRWELKIKQEAEDARGTSQDTG